MVFKSLVRQAEEQAVQDGHNLPQESGAKARDMHVPLEPFSDGGAVVASRQVAKDQYITLELTGLRRERTGLHGRIAILWNRTCLAWNQMNVERDEDRTRLANKAHKMLDHIVRELYPQELLRYDLDHFCLGAWEALLSEQQPEDLTGNPDIPTDFLMHPYLIKGGGTILFGPPGRGKSFTALLAAISIDSDSVEVFPNIIPGKVLFINLERSRASVQRRIGQVNQVLGLNPARPLMTLNSRGKSLGEVYDVAAKAVEEKRVDLVVLDSISRAGQGSLLDDQKVNSTVDLLNNLAETWLAIGHSPRADDSHVFGSVHFEAGADIVVKLQAEKTDHALGIGLEIVKENDVGPTPKAQFAYEFDHMGLVSVRPARDGEFVAIETSSRSPVEEIEEYLLLAGRSTATIISKELDLGRSLVAGLLKNSEKFVQLTRDKQGAWYGIKFDGPE